MDRRPAVINPTLGADGEPCAQCATPLEADQRYCLSCGRRRAPMRLEFFDVVGAAGGDDASNGRPATAGVVPRDGSPLVVLGSLIALLLALGIGVLIGHGAQDDPARAARTPIVTVAAPAPAGAPPAAVISDWPAGTEGYTVALRTLPATASAAQAAQARQAATDQGAADVGLLKSDEYPSLEPGQILVYSGTHTTRAAAAKAGRDLKATFPDAAVVRVATTAGGAAKASPKSTTTAEPSPSASGPRSTPGYGKSTDKLPDKIVTPGAAPPVDDKAPGGGSDEATEIG